MDDLVKRWDVTHGEIAADKTGAWVAYSDHKATIERLSAEKADFHMAYRIKCDEETKRLEARIAALEAERTETIEVIRSVNSKCAALEAENKALLSGQPEKEQSTLLTNSPQQQTKSHQTIVISKRHMQDPQDLQDPQDPQDLKNSITPSIN